MMDPFDARERRWWNKLRCGTAEESASAAFAISTLLCARGCEDEAEAILLQCSDHSDDAIAAQASIRLAQLIERGAGPAAAETAYEAAAERASASQAAAVLIDLAERWVAHGEIPRAREAYGAVVVEADDPQLRAVAGYRLGAIGREEGLLEEAICCWNSALADAGDALRVHLLVNLAEVLQEAHASDLDQAEVLFDEAIHSNHPDLAPRAAVGLAKLKRRRGQLIDAYQLAQLAVESQHPVFAPEGEAERERLVGHELDSLFELASPDREQLRLAEEETSGQCRQALYLPITPVNLVSSPTTEHFCEHFEHSVVGGFEPEQDDCIERYAINASERSGRMAGAFLWRAVLGRLDHGDLWTMRSAIRCGSVRTAQDRPYGGPYVGGDLVSRSQVSLNRWGDGGEDLELLKVLQAAAWLRKQTASGSVSLAPSQFRLIFDRTSARLAWLLGANEGGSQHQPYSGGAHCVSRIAQPWLCDISQVTLLGPECGSEERRGLLLQARSDEGELSRPAQVLGTDLANVHSPHRQMHQAQIEDPAVVRA